MRLFLKCLAGTICAFIVSQSILAFKLRPADEIADDIIRDYKNEGIKVSIDAEGNLFLMR